MFYWQTNSNEIVLLTQYCWERKENFPMDNCQEIMKAWKLSDFCSDAHTIHILSDIFCRKSFNVIIFWNLYFLFSFTSNLRQYVLIQSVLKKWSWLTWIRWRARFVEMMVWWCWCWRMRYCINVGGNRCICCRSMVRTICVGYIFCICFCLLLKYGRNDRKN